MQDRQLQTTWEGATDKIVAGLKHIKAQYGPQAIGGMISPHCTNEEIYLFQKLMRKVIGTPNIDSGARYGHINAVAGLNDVFGTTRLARYEDIVEADVLLAFAGELTESNPITGLKVKEAIKKRGRSSSRSMPSTGRAMLIEATCRGWRRSIFRSKWGARERRFSD